MSVSASRRGRRSRAVARLRFAELVCSAVAELTTSDSADQPHSLSMQLSGAPLAATQRYRARGPLAHRPRHRRARAPRLTASLHRAQLTASSPPPAVLSLFFSSATALVVTPALRPALTSRAATPAMTMMVGETATSISSITTVVADDSLLLASGGLIGFLFVFLVVGTIIVNFGIMKK